jgi:hypothetical protein
MSTYDQSSTLTGLFKEAYADELINLIPQCSILYNAIKFVERKQETGNLYHQPVIVSNEQGFTYALTTTGAASVNNPIAMATADAQLQGTQILLATNLSYEAAAKASNSTKAFVEATELMVENMLESMHKRLEICLIYGQSSSGLATIGSYTNIDGSDTTLVVSSGQWSSGIWSGAENSQLNFYANGTLINSSTGTFTITAVNAGSKTITVSGASADITALQNSITAGTTVAAFFNGAYSTEFAGVQNIFSNTGTYANISATTYNLWQANNVTVTGQLTLGKILSAVATAVGRGLNEKAMVLVNPVTWANLNTDLAALRRFDKAGGTGDNAYESLQYYAQNGLLEVVSHIMVKEGDAFIFPVKRLKRIGAQDVSFKTPGRGEDIFLHLQTVMAYQMRLYTNQALLVETPARCVYLSGFTNS